MARKLVVCCDGTWNKPRTGTNVFRIYRHLAGQVGVGIGDRGNVKDKEGVDPDCRECDGLATDGSEVRLFYQLGVGTMPGQIFSGGALGLGLSGNVRAAYHFLANNYEPGAEIYVFGFSRGAYTARSLCGFIEATGGLLRKPDALTVLRAYLDEYVTESRLLAKPDDWSLTGVWDKTKSWFGDVVGAGLGDHPRYRDARIRLIGVFDTVGALGVPLPRAAKLNEPIVGFHDTRLGHRIDHAVQALAVDERRGPYAATLWTRPESDKGLQPGQTCLQVWFPGVHSDVGGGYPDRGIGDITLDFMLRRAAEAGLVLDPLSPLPRDLVLVLEPAQHESFDGFWNSLGKLGGDLEQRRTIAEGVGGAGRRLLVEGRQMLHPSLVDRLGKKVGIVEEQPDGTIKTRPLTYSPVNVRWSADAIRAGTAELPLFRERAELRLLVSELSELDGRPCTIRDKGEHGRRIEMDKPPSVGNKVSIGGRLAEVVWSREREAGLRLAA